MALDRGLIDQPQVGFVDQSRGLQGVVAALPAEIPGGQPAEFAIHERYQFVERALITPAPGHEQACHFSGVSLLHRSTTAIVHPVGCLPALLAARSKKRRLSMILFPPESSM